MSVNTVLLVGRLGAAPELKTTPTGKQVCNFSIATSFWDKRTQTEGADWHRIVAWDRTAENCERYLDKGSQVAIEGRLKHSSWTAPDGTKRYKTEVYAARVTFMTPPRRGSESHAGPPQRQEERLPAQVAAEAPPPPGGGRRGKGALLAEIDDIPF